MDDDENFGCLSSSDDDQDNEDEMPKTMPEENIKEEAAVEIEENREIKTIDTKIEPEKEVLKIKAAISLPMTGATEAWMDDDDNFGGFSSSDDDQVDEHKVTNTMPEEQIKEKAYAMPETKIKEESLVEKEESEEIKAIDEEKEVLTSKVAISLPTVSYTHLTLPTICSV